MNSIPHEFSSTCSNAAQGSFSSVCTTTHLSSWKQNDKHRTSPANYYSTWNRPGWLSEASPNLQGWCHPCHNHSDHKLSQNAAGGISGWNLRFLFSAVFSEKGKNSGRCACLIFSQQDMAKNLLQILPCRSGNDPRPLFSPSHMLDKLRFPLF